MAKTSVYELYLSDYNQNFNTLTKEELDTFKKNLTEQDLKELTDLCEEIFEVPLQSVTFDRPEIVAHLNLEPRQYFSLSTYFWPNPDTEDGLPWVRRDGHVHPFAPSWNKKALRDTSFVMYLGSLMYYFTGDKKYYEVVKKHLNHFLIDEKTGMLPNLNYAQMILGDPVHQYGRGTGIIDFACHFGYGLVLVKHLYDLGMIEESFYGPVQNWVRELVKWLETSKFGLHENKSRNNHGTLYTLVRMHLTFFTGDFEARKAEFLAEANVRIASQIAEDGSMVEELLRTRAINYSTMNVKAFADIYKFLGEDYTNMSNIKAALAFLAPILNGEKSIEDIVVVDPKTNEEVRCSQLEGVYLGHFKYYLYYLGKKYGVDFKIDPSTPVPYKYLFTK